MSMYTTLLQVPHHAQLPFAGRLRLQRFSCQDRADDRDRHRVARHFVYVRFRDWRHDKSLKGRSPETSSSPARGETCFIRKPNILEFVVSVVPILLTRAAVGTTDGYAVSSSLHRKRTEELCQWWTSDGGDWVGAIPRLAYKQSVSPLQASRTQQVAPLQ